ncbi:hypothetical protein KAR91_09930 [Candidatus Pacearchaeota archaeon]|nr:hypothetical protein [Candidatus Pacearchaeota archaeon]
MIKYSLLCTTNAAKLAFIERSIRLMQEEHNIMGAWYRPSEPLISETKHNKLRAQVQERWPYNGEKLNKTEWDNYKDGRYKQKMDILKAERGRLKNLLYASTRFSPNLDDDIN